MACEWNGNNFNQMAQLWMSLPLGALSLPISSSSSDSMNVFVIEMHAFPCTRHHRWMCVQAVLQLCVCTHLIRSEQTVAPATSKKLPLFSRLLVILKRKNAHKLNDSQANQIEQLTSHIGMTACIEIHDAFMAKCCIKCNTFREYWRFNHKSQRLFTPSMRAENAISH